MTDSASQSAIDDLSALSDRGGEGAVVVPRVPTEAMELAGMHAPFSERRRATTSSLDRQQAIVADIYAAMLAAAPALSAAAAQPARPKAPELDREARELALGALRAGVATLEGLGVTVGGRIGMMRDAILALSASAGRTVDVPSH